jgi:uncharacterized protein YukE
MTRGAIYFPQEVSCAALSQTAANFTQLAEYLADSARRFSEAGASPGSHWTGSAATEFVDQMEQRASAMRMAHLSVSAAAEAMTRYKSVAYNTSTTYEQAAQTELYLRSLRSPAYSDAIDQAMLREEECRVMLELEAQRCAIAVQNAGIELTSLPNRFGYLLADNKYWYKVPMLGFEGVAHGAHTAVGRYGNAPGTRWLPNRGGPLTGHTFSEAKELSHRLSRWNGRLNVLSGVLAGGTQALVDYDNPNMQMEQRVGRVAAATVLEGGGAWVGATQGATFGAFVGSFVPIPVVGTVVGAAVGGVIGGVIGSKLGKAAKEWLFKWKPVKGLFGND